ncbi:MlaC/ttg2D family ABC transporter substrate-binding protein [Roseospira visakhapatnamensis]|uniref:Phospholipid transport system substrate-binding protein n=1 Tax=Roseospira visakhapatnamensis TaxID=390880 RepID=A0A7W6RA89_9PROT|nr:ABC transporter substrate-binding protein [Roseospira visakhapatnamensis]MBB4264773.1 phospholipid transport system substrate-binding protein [Roseospira visakhapatnamensis]
MTLIPRFSSVRPRWIPAVLVALSLLVAAPMGARAADLPNEPAAFIQAVASHAIDNILTPDISQKERIGRFETLLDEAFDLEAVGRFVVGRAWRTASEEERTEFLRLFKEFNVYNWGSRFDEYGGQQLHVRNVVPDGDKGHFIETEIGAKEGNPFVVTWRVRQRAGGLRIVDLSVEGIWMSQTWRSEYASVLKKEGTVAGLNAVLEQRLEDIRAKTTL